MENSQSTTQKDNKRQKVLFEETLCPAYEKFPVEILQWQVDENFVAL
jgi:hypothetical protein